MKNTTDNVVIIGASHAAAEAISTLRKAGWTGSITLIGDENELPYQRPPLSKGYFKDELVAEKLAIKKPEFYATANVDLYLGRRAQAINRDDKYVVLDNREKIAFSHVILAIGTRARHLSVTGGELPCVKYLRTVADVDNIKQTLRPNSKLLIVGAGYIGLEVATSAVKQGMQVTVLEAMDRVLARVTSPAISEFYQGVHAEEGVDIMLNSALDRFEPNGDKGIAILAEGQRLDFDCAIVGIGVVPNVELAEQAGLACDNGIVVDEYTRTEDASIYAIGDCCNHPSLIYQRRIRLESVPNAVAQAKTAANAICGNNIVYDQLPWFWSDQYDIKLQSAGLLQGYDHFEVNGATESRKFSVSYFKCGELIALDAVNSPADFMKAKKLITQTAAQRK